jgi:hypothetical protein
MTLLRRFAACALLLSLTACSGGGPHPATPATSSASAPPARLTLATARGIFTGFLTEFENLPANPAQVAQVTRGPVKLAESFGRGNSGPPPGQLSGLRILVPQLTTYPRWFIAAGQSHSRQGFLFVLAQQSASGPWRAAAELYDLSVPSQILHDLSFGGLTASGYVATTPADSPTLTIRPADLSAAYARYLNRGARGMTFLAGGYTTSYVRSIPAIAAGARAHGWRYAEVQNATPDPVYAVTLPTGGALVVFDTRDTTSWTATSASALIPSSSATGLDSPPLSFLQRLGISRARAGLRVTAGVVEQNLAYVLPAGSAGVTIVVNDGKVISVAKS